MRNIIKRRYLIPILLIAVLTVIIFFMIYNDANNLVDIKSPRVENGIMNLSGWDFNNDRNIKLDGNWEFYWNQIIPPGGFDEPDVKLTGYYPVPLYWTKYNSLNLPPRGYATYRLIIGTNGWTQLLSLKTPDIYTEYNLWINGRLIDSNGSFANRSARYLRPDIYTFDVNASTVEIVLQIKNYAHGNNAGIGQSFTLGAPDSMNKERNTKAAIDVIFFAICLFAGLYHAILFIFRKKDRELLYFVVLCIAVSIRTILSNETWLMQFFPNLPFEIGSRVVTITIPVCVISLLFYIRVLFKEEMPRLVFYILLGASGLYALLVITTPTFFYSSQFNYYLITVDVLFVTGVYCSVKAIRKGKLESAIFLAGAILLGIGAFNDILYYNQILDTGYYLSLGLMAFVVIQAVVLAVRYANAYHAIEKLSENLKASLEQVAATETAFLHAQIKPHFLYNTLNVIAALCRMDAGRARELILDLSSYLHHSFEFKNLDRFITFDEELEFIQAYVRIEQARFKDKLKVTYELEDTEGLKLPPLILQPLVENAIRHGIRKSDGGGMVVLRVKNQADCYEIEVEDNGAGMTVELLKKIKSDNRDGENGVGLANIQRRLRMLYGTQLNIQSQVGEGTKITLTLRKDQD